MATALHCTNPGMPRSYLQPWQTASMDAAASLIVIGYAKVPVTAASHASHEFFSISLRIDRHTGTVTEVDSTAVTALVRNWLSELLLGVNFTADITPILGEIDAHYLGQAAASIKQGISDAWRRYASYRKN